jgi:hypothetical protein
LAVSSEWEAQIPGAGLYNIWVPLDEPLVVNGPFFAGFYIGNAFDEGVNAAVLTDNFPVPCATYNIWDETIGWVDLADNEEYNFPGRLVMEVAGVPGGVAGPKLELLNPSDGDVLYANEELWAWDAQMTGETEYIVFEYSNGGPFVEIGSDFDGATPLRDGVNPTLSGTGFSLNWDFSSLSEGNHDLRVTLVDTVGTSWSQTVSVYLEPTPPVATITSPNHGNTFCSPVDIDMTTADENLALIQVYHRAAEAFVSVGTTPLDQALVGDADGDPTDGNSAINREFGDYYSAPAAVAVAARVWADRGHPGLVTRGSTTMTPVQVAEELAAAFNTRTHLGAYDEAVFSGLKQYAATQGGGFQFDYKRQPDYADLRMWVEDEERVLVLGLGGNPGHWISVEGFMGWKRLDGSYSVDVATPLGGTIKSASWRDLPSYSEINLSGEWHRVEMAVSILVADWTVTRPTVGIDVNGLDGWSVAWNPSGMTDGTYHYLHSLGLDQDQNQGPYSILVEHNCASVYVPGDFDNDRNATVSDLFRLIDFIAHDGPAPEGGAMRADCNCDNVINVADIIYYMNYLYGAASPPCR